MNQPVQMAATAMIRCSATRAGLISHALAATPTTAPSSISANRVCSCVLARPSVWKKPMAPVLCSDSTSRINRIASPSRNMSALASQRVLIIGLRRLCSIQAAVHSSTMDAASTTPSHGVLVHHSRRPSESTAAMPAAPAANRLKVRKSSGSNTRYRSLGGNLSASTQASANTASPHSNRYRPCHSPNSSRSVENTRASGNASWVMPRPSTTALSRYFVGNAWIT